MFCRDGLPEHSGFFMNMKRAVKASKQQDGYGITILLKDNKVAWFVIPANQCDRVERCLEAYKQDKPKFVEFDTVKEGVVVLNLQHVTAAEIDRRLYKATGLSSGDKSLTIHFAGARPPESITAAETGDITLLANILNTIEVDESRFVFIETERCDRKFFSVGDFTDFELPYYNPTD